jgi:thiol:disulfide interchange protein DsbD
MRRIILLAGLASLPILSLLFSADPILQAAQKKSDKFADAIPKVEAKFEPGVVRRGQTITWTLSVDVADGWHTYPTLQAAPEASSYQNSIEFPETGDVVFVGDLTEPDNPVVKIEKENLKQYAIAQYEGKAVWKRTAVVNPKAAPGEKTITVPVRILACDASKCLPPKSLKISASLRISDEPALVVESAFAKAVESAPPNPGTNPDSISGNKSSPSEVKTPRNGTATSIELGGSKDELPDDYKAELQTILAQLQRLKVQDGGLLAFIWAGIFWGAISLVTPCVFPMIPITVSFFLKQSEKEHHRPLATALVYCTTIVVVLTIAAVVLLSFFRLLSVHPAMNFGLGLLFVVFALSLLGMFDLELPAGVARFTSAREGKGGYAGTMFMALTFTVVSFACVAPFLGGFGGTAASAQMGWTARVLGGLAFAATFALPFFILALFPSLLRKMPKSGEWLNNVKVVMGFLELAAALVFFRTGELVLSSQVSFFTYDLVLGLWIALAFFCGLYLLNIFRLPHDTPVEHLGVPRMLFGLLFIGLGIYLLPAMFKFNAEGDKQRPNGVVYAWIDAFLLPEPRESTKEGLAWSGNLKAAIEEVRAQRNRTGQPQLVFVDFTGKSCKNCKYNENNVFTKSDVKDLLHSYKLVQLYTDVVPTELYPPNVRAKLNGTNSRQNADAETNLWFQKEAFDTEQLPLYVILAPDGENRIKILGVYSEGKINNVDEFAEFLRKPLEDKGGTQVGMS